jgi:sortase B
MAKIQRIFYDQQQQFQQKPFQETSFEELLRHIIFNEEISTNSNMKSEIWNILPKYRPLLEINEDVVGWIKIPNTSIDYPVLQADDNEYYLNRNIYREKNRAGSIFMDYRIKLDSKDRHIIIYGHHMRDGTMFKDLIKYKNKDFFYTNNIIQFDTLYEEIKWEVFSVYITGTDFNYIKTHFNTPAEYENFLIAIKNKSLFPTDVELTADDQILTLSTCTYEYNDARFVVHARRVQ